MQAWTFQNLKKRSMYLIYYSISDRIKTLVENQKHFKKLNHKRGAEHKFPTNGKPYDNNLVTEVADLWSTGWVLVFRRDDQKKIFTLRFHVLS